MSAAAVEKLIWVLVYGGLLLVGLGIAVQRSDAALGLGMIVFGAIDAVIGAVLIWVRSRMKAGGDS